MGIKWGILFCSVVVISGCSFFSQDVTLKPHIIADHNQVCSKTINFQVLDKRTEKTVGYRSIIKTGRISLSNDPVAVVKAELGAALKSKGFILVENDANATATLIVSIKAMRYAMATDAFEMQAARMVDIDAQVKSGNESKYYKLYHVDDRSTYAIAPESEENARIINFSLSHALTDLMHDFELFKILCE